MKPWSERIPAAIERAEAWESRIGGVKIDVDFSGGWIAIAIASTKEAWALWVDERDGTAAFESPPVALRAFTEKVESL